MAAELIFPRRAFQRELIRRLRTASAPIVLDRKLIAELVGNVGRADSTLNQGQASEAIAELIEQRILTCPKTSWSVGEECQLSREPILGETPEERFARLPNLPELPRGMILAGNVLLLVDAVLFFVFYCVYLPQSWIGPVTGTGALIGALLSYAGLKLSNESAVTALRWTFRKWFTIVAIGSFLLLVNLIGYFHPCIVRAPPGTTVLVDGKFATVIPFTGTEDDRVNPRKWLENGEARLHLRWDPHDIQLKKQWHVDQDFNPEPSRHVLLHWTKPSELFGDWNFTAFLSPFLRIAPDPTQASDEKFAQRLADWDQIFHFILFDSVEDLGASPLTLRVSVQKKPDRSATLQCAFINTHGDLLLPLPAVDVKDFEAEDNWNQARRQVFLNLDRLLQVHQLLPKDDQVEGAKERGEIITSTEHATEQAVRERNFTAVEDLTEKLKSIADGPNPQLAQLARTAQHSLDRVAPTPAPINFLVPGSIVRLPASAFSTKAASENVPPRIYIHIAGESQRRTAEDLAEKLKHATPTSFSVPGIENVLGRAFIPDRLEIRYYTKSPSSLNAIKEIVMKMGARSLETVRIKPSTRDIEESRDINSHYEIWFGRDWP
jgi:hypothetical protein